MFCIYSSGRYCLRTLQWSTWPVVLFPVLEGLDKRLRFAFVGPPVGNVRPQLAVTAGDAVLIGHNEREARPPEVSEC